MSKQNVFTQAWKDAQATAKRQSKARAKGKPVKKRTVKDNTKRCDLCGRQINDKAVVIGPGEVWCFLCVKHHTLYPEPCKSCDGYFHFPPGITLIDDIAHAAMSADHERFTNDNRYANRKA